MSRVKGLRAWLSSLHRGRRAARMAEEFEFHVAMETEENIRRGLAPAEARRRAQMAFGGSDRHAEGMRDGWALRWLSDMRQDVRFGLRGLARTPVVALVAIVTIGLAVGATTALFSLANAVLLRALPIPAADRVVTVQEHRSGMVSTGVEGNRIPWTRYVEYRDAGGAVFSALAAHRTTTVSLRTAEYAQPAFATLISGDYFAVLALTPELGRFPSSADEAVVVLSHSAWQREFGGSADVIGSTAWVDGGAYSIGAVAPAGFRGTVFGMVPEVWVPFESYVSGRDLSFEQWVTPFGRLRRGVSEGSAQAAMEAIARRFEDPDASVRAVTLERLGGITGEGRRIAVQFMTMLVAAALLVLFIAASNIAGMLLARAMARRREIAVRLSIGAGRSRLVRQLLTESVLLFLLGGAAGVALAFGLTDLLSRVRVPTPGVSMQLSATPDVRVLLFALVISVIPALLFGLLPALQSTRPDLVPSLRDSVPGSGLRSVRLRSIFVAAQLAVAVLLLVTAGLFVRSVQHGLQVDPGFDQNGVSVAGVNLTPHGYDELRGRAFYDELAARVRRQPGVSSVALARRVLLAGESYGTVVRAPDGPAGERRTNVGMNVVDTAYFTTLRVPLLAGRGFSAQDGASAPSVAVINETLATRLWPDANPLGRIMLEGDRELQVIGVVADGKYVEIGEARRAFAFLPYAQNYSGQMVLHVRGETPPAELMSRLREGVRALDANVALDFAVPLSQMTAFTLFPQRFAATLVGLLGLLGLLLAGIGIYGVLMYHVAQGAREFGIRIALGATTRDVASGVIGRSLRITGIGVVIGLAGAWFMARLLAGFIIGISARDPAAFAVAPVILAILALLAAWHPARRALRVDPMRVLRSD